MGYNEGEVYGCHGGHGGKNGASAASRSVDPVAVPDDVAKTDIGPTDVSWQFGRAMAGPIASCMRDLRINGARDSQGMCAGSIPPNVEPADG